MKRVLSFLLGRISITHWLVASTVGLFFIFWILLGIGVLSLDSLSLQGMNFIGGAYWTLFTSIFLHQSLFHLLANMFTLYFIGTFCEHLIGRKRFLFLYFFAGILGGLTYVGGVFLGTHFSWGASVLGTPETYAAGASGALFGLIGVLAVLIPRHRIYLIVGPLLVLFLQVIVDSTFKGWFGTLLSFVLTFVMLFQLIALFSFRRRWQRFALPLALPLWLAPVIAIVPLVLISFFIPLPIGNSAHFGGLLAGLLYGWVLRFSYPRKSAVLRRVFR
jgi:membrane associated rhomboid family serine protease